MTDERPLVGSVTVQHRINRGDTSVMVKLEFDQTGDDKEDAKKAQNAAFVAKALAWEELGVEFEQNDSGVLVPKGGWSVVVRREGGKSGGGELPSKPAHIQQWLWDLLVNRRDEWFDNRADKASGEVPANRPDFKSKFKNQKGEYYTIYLTPREG